MFSGELVRLGPVTRDDLALFARWFSDPALQRFIAPGIIRLYTEEDEQTWFDAMQAELWRDRFLFAIRSLAGDELIGNCSLFRVDWANALAHFGIAIGDKGYWGRGYGTDATRLLMRYAFDELNLNRVELRVGAYNPRAVRSYEKVGFTLEGTLRREIFHDGVYYDAYLMGLLREDWRAKEQTTHVVGG